MAFVYDPEDEPTQRDPYPAYRRLRDEHPVYRQERLRFWALSRFDDVFAALRDHDVFWSRQGLTWDPRAAEQAGILPMMVTTDPDRLDVDRAPERHLAFGQGAHYCIGAALARLMGRVALEELTTRLGPHRIDEDRAQRLRAGVVRGYRSLPITVG